MAEVQHLFRSEQFSIISGIGHFDQDREALFTYKDQPIIDEKTNPQHTNLYVYSYFNNPKNVTFTFGGSVDFFEDTLVDRNQINPKFGLTWDPHSGTTVRAAIFRNLTRTLLMDQTIEPTQVAGFNQFFDDAETTDVWQYGVAVDQKISKQLYAGAEFSQRRATPAPAASISGPAPVPSVPPLRRDPFRFADDEPAVSPEVTTSEWAPPEPTPSLAPSIRLSGLVRRAGQIRAVLSVPGGPLLLGAGEEAEGYRVLEIDEEAGVRVRLPDGREIKLELLLP